VAGLSDLVEVVNQTSSSEYRSDNQPGRWSSTGAYIQLAKLFFNFFTKLKGY